MDDLTKIIPFLTPLKIMKRSEGSVMHGLKTLDNGYQGFGEAYFSTVNSDCIKGWKLHREMTLNLLVPHGKIRFLVHNAGPHAPAGEVNVSLDTVLGPQNYSRLTVPPGFWVAFQGVSRHPSLLLNVASIPHDPDEAISKAVDYFLVEGFNLNVQN